MKPEYAEEMKKLGVPFNYTDLMHPDKEREAFFLESANNYHALKSAVEELRDAVGELVEVATMRGDNCLPNPCDDPKLWSGRMQEAWNFVERALKETEGL